MIILNRNSMIKELTFKNLQKISERFNLELKDLESLKFETEIPNESEKRIKGEFILNI